MQPPVPVGELLTAIAARVSAGGDVSPSSVAWPRSTLVSGRAVHSAARDWLSTPGGVGGWVLTLVSVLALLAVGGAAAHFAQRWVSRSTPELTVLLNQSAAFYSRCPEDQLASVPRGELVAEAARCQRIIKLLECRAAAGIDSGPASRGPIDGLQAWIALLRMRIAGCADAPAGTAYA